MKARRPRTSPHGVRFVYEATWSVLYGFAPPLEDSDAEKERNSVCSYPPMRPPCRFVLVRPFARARSRKIDTDKEREKNTHLYGIHATIDRRYAPPMKMDGQKWAYSFLFSMELACQLPNERANADNSTATVEGSVPLFRRSRPICGRFTPLVRF